MSDETSVQQFYDALADEFRVQDAFWDNAYDREIWRLEHDLLRPRLRDGDRLLDVGCGFYPHFDFTKTCDVVAGDLSFKSLLSRDIPKKPEARRKCDVGYHDVWFLDNQICWRSGTSVLNSGAPGFPSNRSTVRILCQG